MYHVHCIVYLISYISCIMSDTNISCTRGWVSRAATEVPCTPLKSWDLTHFCQELKTENPSQTQNSTNIVGMQQEYKDPSKYFLS